MLWISKSVYLYILGLGGIVKNIPITIRVKPIGILWIHIINLVAHIDVLLAYRLLCRFENNFYKYVNIE